MLITEIRFLHVQCRLSLSSPKARPTLPSQTNLGRSAVTAIARTFGWFWLSALPLVVLFAVAPTAANAQARIGSAQSVQPEASGSIAGTLSAGSGVHANETVRTGTSGQAGLQFNDQSNLTVGHSSQVRLDKFVYDPNKGTGSAVIEATRGTFRFTTGAENRITPFLPLLLGGEVKIKTPYGTLGIRG
jgi:trimeric autotransporter adhesin